MRLIDADALRRTHKVAFNGNIEEFANEWVSALAINNAPTIEAIPIEWIKEFIAKKGWARHYLTEEIINAWEAENG